MHPISRAVYRFNLCLLNLLGAALFLAAAYDLRQDTQWGGIVSEFCGVSLLVAIAGISIGAYRVALWAQWLAIVGPIVLLSEFLSSTTTQNTTVMHFLTQGALWLIGYLTLLALAVSSLSRRQKS
ncbi:MAG: hypothetical protein QM758_08865 [Armatimonas sp.]